MNGKELEPILNDLINRISARNTYSGRKISQSIIDMLKVEVRENGAGILAPYWLGVLEHGRGPRKSTVDTGLYKKIYAWMEKHNLFKSRTQEGKLRESKSLTWYLNKYGNQQFRNKAFADIYTSERKKTIEEINAKYSNAISKITMDIL